jgi:large subunit ribosomal protein L20
MTRVKGGPAGHRKKRNVVAKAKGYRGSRSKLHRRAREAVVRAGEHEFAGRRIRRRDLRKLWIIRINAALTPHEILYSRFIKGLKLAKVELDRKILANLAFENPKAFEEVIKKVKPHL